MIGKGATPSFFAIANDNYTLTIFNIIFPNIIILAYIRAFIPAFIILYQLYKSVCPCS